MTTHEFDPRPSFENHKGEYVTIIVNDTAKIEELFELGLLTEKTSLDIDTAVLPPPIKKMQIDLLPAERSAEDGRHTVEAQTPPSIYAEFQFPEISPSMRDNIIANIVTSFHRNELEAFVLPQIEDDEFIQHHLIVEHTDALEITSSPTHIGIKATFPDESDTSNNQKLKNFYFSSVSVIDGLTEYFPSEASGDEMYEIHVKPPASKEIVVFEDATEEMLLLPQHRYGKLDDVGGLTNAKEKLAENGLAWTYPDLAKEFDVHPTHFVLAGPPGTGKTTLVNAFANQFGAVVMKKKSSDIVNCYIGESASRLSKTFAEALSAAESQKIVLFFDEMDSLIASNSNRSHEFTQLINMFKDEIESLPNKTNGHNVIVAGATNADIDDLDPAIVRSGRLEPIAAPLPNYSERVDIWGRLVNSSESLQKSLDTFININNELKPRSKGHVSLPRFADDVSVHRLAELTDDKSGADFVKIITEINKRKFKAAAGILAMGGTLDFAANPEMKQISQADLDSAISRFGFI